MKIIIKILIFSTIYRYLELEGLIAFVLIWLTMQQIDWNHYSPIRNLILFFVILIITIIYLGFFFNLPVSHFSLNRLTDLG